MFIFYMNCGLYSTNPHILLLLYWSDWSKHNATFFSFYFAWVKCMKYFPCIPEQNNNFPALVKIEKMAMDMFWLWSNWSQCFKQGFRSGQSNPKHELYLQYRPIILSILKYLPLSEKSYIFVSLPPLYFSIYVFSPGAL